MTDLRQHDWGADPLFDSAIVSHGFAGYMRDYDVIVEVPAAAPGRPSGTYIEGRYRYRFTHCVEVRIDTRVTPASWRESWTDEFTSRSAWERAGHPDGFVWGVGFAVAYPGASSIASSERAAQWEESLGRAMHEVRIETDVYVLRLVCHDLRVARLAAGDPLTGELTPVEPQP